MITESGNSSSNERVNYYLSPEISEEIAKIFRNNFQNVSNINLVFQIGSNDIKYDSKSDTARHQGNDDINGAVKRITAKTGMSDIVRIFEALKEAGIISSKTEVSQIANLFFGDTIDKQRFTAGYNSRKNEIKTLDRNSNSTELLKFIKILTENCFSKKDTQLDEIIKHIELLQKKRI